VSTRRRRPPDRSPPRGWGSDARLDADARMWPCELGVRTAQAAGFERAPGWRGLRSASESGAFASPTPRPAERRQSAKPPAAIGTGDTRSGSATNGFAGACAGALHACRGQRRLLDRAAVSRDAPVGAERARSVAACLHPRMRGPVPGAVATACGSRALNRSSPVRRVWPGLGVYGRGSACLRRCLPPRRRPRPNDNPARPREQPIWEQCRLVAHPAAGPRLLPSTSDVPKQRSARLPGRSVRRLILRGSSSTTALAETSPSAGPLAAIVASTRSVRVMSLASGIFARRIRRPRAHTTRC
jgi:hypothetical protein